MPGSGPVVVASFLSRALASPPVFFAPSLSASLSPPFLSARSSSVVFLAAVYKILILLRVLTPHRTGIPFPLQCPSLDFGSAVTTARGISEFRGSFRRSLNLGNWAPSSPNAAYFASLLLLLPLPQPWRKTSRARRERAG
jgi:hypothetical protein